MPNFFAAEAIIRAEAASLLGDDYHPFSYLDILSDPIRQDTPLFYVRDNGTTPIESAANRAATLYEQSWLLVLVVDTARLRDGELSRDTYGMVVDTLIDGLDGYDMGDGWLPLEWAGTEPIDYSQAGYATFTFNLTAKAAI